MKEASVVLIIRETNVPKFPVGFQREVLAVSSRKFTTMVLPGGTVDPGELPMETAVRELQEEISVVLDPKRDVRYIGSGISSTPGAPDWRVHLYYARAIWGQPTKVENGTELRWLSWQTFLESTFFADYYRTHLPNGIDMYPPTRILGVAA